MKEGSQVPVTSELRHYSKCFHHLWKYTLLSLLLLGTGGVQGQGKGQRLMGIKAVNDSTGLATCQGKIYDK